MCGKSERMSYKDFISIDQLWHFLSERGKSTTGNKHRQTVRPCVPRLNCRRYNIQKYSYQNESQ